ncbi:MAG: hypothetical protein J3K34DRAFT_502386 [Monoraphidium minutum]|nr:MAG: hypothetical protein J3K34DRAFT_502386 [Monoraphidium minutum]
MAKQNSLYSAYKVVRPCLCADGRGDQALALDAFSVLQRRTGEFQLLFHSSDCTYTAEYYCCFQLGDQPAAAPRYGEQQQAQGGAQQQQQQQQQQPTQVVQVVQQVQQVQAVQQPAVVAMPRTRVFYGPTYQGIPVDVCLQYGTQCDGEAASYWCQLKGYARAISFKTADVSRSFKEVSEKAAPWTGNGNYTEITVARAAGAARGGAARRAAVARAAATAFTEDMPHIQLATAKLPSAANEAAFKTALYQHVATLTQNGANLPFVLPLRVDRLEDGGFQVGLLRRGDGGAFGAAVEITGTVEDVDGVGRVLFMRMFEGPAAFAGREYKGSSKEDDRLEAVISSHPDVTTIMATMEGAIRKAAFISMQRA